MSAKPSQLAAHAVRWLGGVASRPFLQRGHLPVYRPAGQGHRLTWLPRARPVSPLSPPADDPLVASIAQQLLSDREGHDKTAAEWTKRYAQG